MSYKDKPILKLYKYENSAFVLQAIIDDFQEVSFEHNIYEAGTFTITINYNIPNALKFERGLFVQFGNNSYDFGEILTISDSIGEDGKGSQTRTITGKDARYIFKRRVIKNLNNEENWAMTDKGEICLRELVKAQCGAAAEAKRQLPVANTIPESASAIGKEYSVAEAFSNLYDTLVTIATQSEIGWRIKFDGTLTLEVFQGSDLSNQVQFSTDFDSLANGEFTDSAESYANTVYVAGKGTGSDRDIYEGEQEIEGSSPSGLDRYEAYDNQSQMTSESEYEAEALSMLTQYGQTLTMSGNGVAKCPYIFKEQYNIGDTITLAFSGKSAKAQILSVTENWSWGQYGISFSFGKPQNDLSRQLQLILKQIQKASSKTISTSSVKYYTIPTDTQMPKADVIYDTIGFQGTCADGGSTFQLYWDSEKTGAKTYHVWLKQLGGGKLTLTTGVSGASNLVLNSGTYVAIIYVDQDGNVNSQGATATTTIETGNTQPATSGGVADAIAQITDTNIIYDANITDCNNAWQKGKTVTYFVQGISNVPNNNNGWYIMAQCQPANLSSNNYVTQIATPSTNNNVNDVYTRHAYLSSGTMVWTSWKRLTTTTDKFQYVAQKQLSSAGWYKIATLGGRAYGATISIDLFTTYQYQRNCSHNIKVNYGWVSSSVKDFAKDLDAVFDKIRICFNANNEDQMAIYVHYRPTQVNPCYVNIQAGATALVPVNFETDSLAWGTTQEFNLGTDGEYINGDKATVDSFVYTTLYGALSQSTGTITPTTDYTPLTQEVTINFPTTKLYKIFSTFLYKITNTPSTSYQLTLHIKIDDTVYQVGSMATINDYIAFTGFATATITKGTHSISIGCRVAHNSKVVNFNVPYYNLMSFFAI
ncbi:Gp37-like protein [Methanobrevibacter sp.]|uniref:Gp37-like protein n=1 Tax=Methanobrevibacter sp. TaxID=66852 RepID=UPI00386FCCDA